MLFLEKIAKFFGKKKRVKFKDIPDKEKPNMFKIKFVLNEYEFEKFDATLRNHQRNSIEALKDVSIGQINIPTGTGKTYIQKHILVKDMIDKTKSNQTGIYVIAAHRLTLCTQLFNEVLDLSIKCGIKADMIYLGTGGYDFSALNHKYRHMGFAIAKIDGESTTSGKDIIEFANRARIKNNHLIIVSTYHSFDRLADLDCIDICTFDEAHTTISDRFTKNIEKVKGIIGKQYFFTATRKVIGDDGGQADTEFYGKVEYEMSPKEAMDNGEIVRPYIHMVLIGGEINEIDPLSNVMAIKTVKEAFLEHKNKIKSDSYNPTKIGGKLLVTVDGLKELHSVYSDKEFQEWCKINNIRTFAFSSDEGQFIDFSSSSRQRTLEAMNNLKNNEDAILFHYDILTEGIDLPAITGVLLLRDLPLTKLLQNVGRGARLLKEDRIKLYSGEILPTDYKKMIKPYCLIIIPHYPNMEYDKTKKIIKSLRDAYRIPLENVGKKDKAIADIENFVPFVTEWDEQKSGKQYPLEHVFEEILMEEFEQNFWWAENKIEFMKETIGKCET